MPNPNEQSKIGVDKIRDVTGLLISGTIALFSSNLAAPQFNTQHLITDTCFTQHSRLIG